MSTVTDTLPASFTTRRTRIASVTPAPQPRLLTGPVFQLFAADFAAMVSFYLLLSVVPLYAIRGGQRGLERGVRPRLGRRCDRHWHGRGHCRIPCCIRRRRCAGPGSAAARPANGAVTVGPAQP
jgi:hypothetical protein